MSADEILAELPKLTTKEIETIYHRAEVILQEQSDQVSPELLAAIDEAESISQSEDIDAQELRNRIKTWAHSK